MKIKLFLFYFIFFLSCTTIKDVKENDGTISIGNSNIIFSNPDKSRNYSRQEIEIQTTSIRKEMSIIDKSMSEISKNQDTPTRSPNKKNELKKLEKRKDKYQKLLEEWEKLTE